MVQEILDEIGQSITKSKVLLLKGAPDPIAREVYRGQSSKSTSAYSTLSERSGGRFALP